MMVVFSGMIGGWHGTVCGRCRAPSDDAVSRLVLKIGSPRTNPVRVLDAFVEVLDLGTLGFAGVDAAATGRPGYHPAALLTLYVYGYLNRAPSSRRLEREADRNVEVMWLTGQLSPDYKTMAEFRRQNGSAIGHVCARFVALCCEIGLLSHPAAD